MSAASCWRSVLRNWYLLVLCALAATGAALFVTLRDQAQYSSSLRLAVGPSPAITRQSLVTETVDALNKRTLITTLAEIAGGQRVFNQAAAGLGLPSEDAARYRVSSVALPEANVIALDVQGPDRNQAAALAGAVAGRSISSIQSFYTTLAVRELDVPRSSDDPVTPKPKRDVPLAAAGGLCFGFFLGLCRDYLRERRWRGIRQPGSPDS